MEVILVILAMILGGFLILYVAGALATVALFLIACVGAIMWALMILSWLFGG